MQKMKRGVYIQAGIRHRMCFLELLSKILSSWSQFYEIQTGGSVACDQGKTYQKMGIKY